MLVIVQEEEEDGGCFCNDTNDEWTTASCLILFVLLLKLPPFILLCGCCRVGAMKTILGAPGCCCREELLRCHPSIRYPNFILLLSHPLESHSVTVWGRMALAIEEEEE